MNIHVTKEMANTASSAFADANLNYAEILEKLNDKDLPNIQFQPGQMDSLSKTTTGMAGGNNFRKARQAATAVPMKEKRAILKKTKTIKTGNSCLVIMPNGKMNMVLIPKSNTEEWLNDHIGFKVTTEHADYLEIGKMECVMIAYSEVSTMKPNKIATALRAQKTNGIFIIYSTVSVINMDEIKKLSQAIL